MSDVDEWGVSASDNNVTSPAGAQTGWVGADVGPWARETMAAVARANADPAWANFTKYGLSPTGTKTITRTGASQVQLATTGSDWAATTADVFAVNRLIRLKRTTGQYVYGFITSRTVAGTTLTVNLALLGESAIDSSWNFSDNECEFFVAMDAVDTDRAEQPLASFAFGGGGTTTERDARFPDVSWMPEGILWSNTTDDLLQIVHGTAGSRAWQDIAPLTSAWSDAGGDLTLASSGGSLLTLNSASNNSSSLRLMESNVKRSRFVYDANANLTVLEGGDAAGEQGQIRISDSDGKLTYRRWTGGVAQAAQNLTPGEVFAWPATNLAVRTGGGSSRSVYSTAVEAVSGTLPSEVQSLLESSDWDELTAELFVVDTSSFAGSATSGGTYTLRLFLGDDLHVTPPASLGSGENAEFTFTQGGVNPRIGLTNPTGTNDINARILNSDLSGTINSFFISVVISGVGNAQTFEWLENSGDSYSTIRFKDITRVVT